MYIYTCTIFDPEDIHFHSFQGVGLSKPLFQEQIADNTTQRRIRQGP